MDAMSKVDPGQEIRTPLRSPMWAAVPQELAPSAVYQAHYQGAGLEAEQLRLKQHSDI